MNPRKTTHPWMRGLLTALALAAVGVLAPAAPALAAAIDGGSACGFQSAQLTLPIDFANDGHVTALQFDLQYAATSLAPVAVGFSGASDHAVDFAEVGEGLLRVALYSATGALVPDGEVLHVTLSVEPGAAGGSVPLPLVLAAFATRGAASREPEGAPAPAQVELAVIAPPQDAVVCNGATAVLTAGVTGPGTPSFQWLKDGQPLPGANQGSLTIAPAQNDDIGYYQVEVQNACGSGTSDLALLNLNGVCAPDGLVAYSPGVGNRLDLRWSRNPSADVNGYRVLWGTQPDGPYTFQQDLGVADRHRVDSLPNGTRFYFRVSAVVDALESPFSNESDAAVAADGLPLPQAPDYGYQTTPGNDLSHADVVTYQFDGRKGDITLWYDVYDIDSAGEVHLRLNGVPLADAPVTGPSSWAGAREIVLPDELVEDRGLNVLTFDNTLDLETWGVRRVSLKLPPPTAQARAWNRTVDLGFGSPVVPDLAGYDIYRATFPGFAPIPSRRIASGVRAGGYRDSGLDNGTTYYYVVRPLDTIANPGFDSVHLQATPTAAGVTPVMDLRVDKSGTQDLALTWSPVTTSAGVQFYRLYEGGAPDALTPTGAEPTAASTLRSGDQADAQLHFYYLSVVDGTDAESDD